MDNKESKVSFKKLDQLIIKFQKARGSYEKAMADVGKELELLTGKTIVYNDFPGDGLGVMVADPDDPGNTTNYMGLNYAKALILEKGTIDFDDFTYL